MRGVMQTISMKIDPVIDTDIQKSLQEAGIAYPVDRNGRIAVHEFRMDTRAKVGMAYFKASNKVPKGALPFLVISAQWVYGVFHYESKGVAIEVGEKALIGKVVDYSDQSTEM